jgi:hypothetical protein
MSGDKLSTEARQQLLGAAEQVYTEASKNLGDLNTRYSGIAGNYKLDPSRIVQNPEQYDPIAPPAAQQDGAASASWPDAQPGPGDPAAVSPGGQRVIKQMTNPAPVKDWKDWFKKGH